MGNTRVQRSFGVTLAGLVLAAAGCGGEICNADRLTNKLGKAGSGDTVRMGACRIEGNFTVPEGVTLAGAGRAQSFLVSTAGTALVLTPGAVPAKVTGLTVESAGRAGILATGAGAVTVEDVTVNASRGIALGAEALTGLVLQAVTLTGPVTADNVNEVSLLSAGDAPAQTATHGLVLVRVEGAEMSDVSASGFAFFGALLAESTAQWTGGGAPDNLRAGLMVYGGTATLTNLELCRSMLGFQLVAYGGVFAGDASITTSSLTVCDNEGIGLLHDGGTTSHTDLAATSNGNAALWIQNVVASFELSGAGTQIADNAFVGVVVMDSANVTIADAAVLDGTLSRRVSGETGSVELGDGIHLVRSSVGIRLRDLRLSGNDRVGVLIDLGGATIDSTWLSGVTVDASGLELGVVAQNGTLAPGWDDGATRQGTAAANDASFLAAGVPLDTVGIVGPIRMDPPQALLDEGLAALGGAP